MKQRNPFSQVLDLYADTREKLIRFKKQHPERVIGLMFLILLLAVASLLISKATHRQTYTESIRSVSGKLTTPADLHGRPITGDLMDLLSAYGKASTINPDSITAKDSLLLKEIDKDLNKILDEKD